MKKNNVLVIGDTHIPFELPWYLDFCKKVARDWNCTRVVHVGDETDNHAISYHEHNPDLAGPTDELHESIKRLRKWYKAFPNVDVMIGNHTALPMRKIKTAGLPSRYMKTMREILEAPAGWNWHHELEIEGVLYKHQGFGGNLVSMLRGAEHCSQAMVVGHAHSVGGVAYSANTKTKYFVMCVGCGVDRKSLGMEYGSLYQHKPMIGCGVVIAGGKQAHFIPAEM